MELVSESPLRLAVDPHAMAADCSLRAGRAAQAKRQHHLAGAIFRLLKATFPGERYAYYIEQAALSLVELEVSDVLSMEGRPVLVRSRFVSDALATDGRWGAWLTNLGDSPSGEISQRN